MAGLGFGRFQSDSAISYQPLLSDAVDSPMQRRWPLAVAALAVVAALAMVALAVVADGPLVLLTTDGAQFANVTTLVGAAPISCSDDTHGTCLFAPCSKKRGPTECLRVSTFKAKCLCQEGYCAGPDGVCHLKEDLPSFLKSVNNDIGCWKATGGSCKVLDCYKERGPTQCYIGGCYCALGSCAREDGKCYPEAGKSNLVHSGFTIQNVLWPDQKLYVKGCGPNTFKEPAMNAKMDNLIELANSKEDTGDQGKFALYELTPNGNPAYLLQSLAFPKCLVMIGEPWQNHGGQNTYANIYKSVMDEPVEALQLSPSKPLSKNLDGIAWQIHANSDPDRPHQVQIGTTTGLMMYLRTTPISDDPTFDVSNDATAYGPGSFWITDPPLPHIK